LKKLSVQSTTPTLQWRALVCSAKPGRLGMANHEGAGDGLYATAFDWL